MSNALNEFNDEIMNFLKKPENLSLAIDIAKRVNHLRKALHKDMWDMIAQDLTKHLSNSEYSESWEVVAPSDEDTFKTNAMCVITPKITEEIERNRFLRVAIQQWDRSHNFQLYYGVIWNEKLEEDLDNEKLTHLTNWMSARQFNKTEWWPGYKMLRCYPQTDRFVMQMSTDSKSFIATITDKILELYMNVAPNLEAINEQLAGK